MRNVLAALLVASSAISVGAQTVAQRVDREIPQLVETYRMLHAAPELSKQEAKSSAYVASKLREFGYQVSENIGRYEDGSRAHGVVAVLANGKGPVVLIRSDMDALPVTEETGAPFASKVRAKNANGDEVGVMHACGHDLHMTTLIGAAKVLAETKNSAPVPRR